MQWLLDSMAAGAMVDDVGQLVLPERWPDFLSGLFEDFGQLAGYADGPLAGVTTMRSWSSCERTDSSLVSRRRLTDTRSLQEVADSLWDTGCVGSTRAAGGQCDAVELTLGSTAVPVRPAR